MNLDSETLKKQINAALMALANAQRQPVDPYTLNGTLEHCSATTPEAILEYICGQLAWPAPLWYAGADEARCPLFYCDADGVGIVSGRSPEGLWAITRPNPMGGFSEQLIPKIPRGARSARLTLRTPFAAHKSPTTRLIWSEIIGQKKILSEVFAVSLAIGVLAVFVSFYAMQVYDRVIPKSGMQEIGFSTLLTLTIGVLGAVGLELLGKLIRSNHLHHLVDQVDQRLARSTYARMLGIRLDALPPSVGTTAQRVRSYEAVRGFLVTLTTHVVVDIPVSIMMLCVFWLIAGYMAIIPLLFLIGGLILAAFYRQKIEYLTQQAKPSHNLKTGILVETIEGAEIIKSGNGGWRMLSRWLDVTDRARGFDMTIQELTETSQYILAAAQQFSFVLIIAMGAIMSIDGSLTMGQLIACSILSGRIMTPLGALPRMLVQWGQTKCGVEDLDRMWELSQDYADGEQPVLLETVKGGYQINGLTAFYASTPVLKIDQMAIMPGEKVAVIGPVGSGKTTLLRLLSGMYKAKEGRITLDGVELGLISKSVLSNQIGFIPQDGRLFSGDLRSNLVLGMEDPGDEAIIAAAQKTGLMESVISSHPKGMERPISEGGTGLSGGQRQLVHLTRAFLRKPKIWLLDEPTASMDSALELKLLESFSNELKTNPEATFIVVTHKPLVLNYVDRVIVLNAGKVVMTGPRDDVLAELAKLQQRSQEQALPPSETSEASNVK